MLWWLNDNLDSSHRISRGGKCLPRGTQKTHKIQMPQLTKEEVFKRGDRRRLPMGSVPVDREVEINIRVENILVAMLKILNKQR